jgi:hypothetical protein
MKWPFSDPDALARFKGLKHDEMIYATSLLLQITEAKGL